MKVLIVLTSHDQLGDTGQKTGFWLEEFASPYYRLKDAAVNVLLASPQGGLPPCDPKSHQIDFQTDDTRRFNRDQGAQEELANTIKLAEIQPDDFDAIFYPGGHGPLWDLVNDRHSVELIEAFIASEKPVATVCHSPAVLLRARDLNRDPLVKDKNITAFSNSEEAAVGLTDVVPFSLQDRLIELGGLYQNVEDWCPLVVVDGLLITGQNPASSAAVADALVKKLGSIRVV